ncbi:MAG: sigma-70 family RNA polymerase sigma factor [Bacillota bacterium]
MAASVLATDEAALWHAHGSEIYRYLLRLTGRKETAEDLTQETFLRAIRQLRSMKEPPENPRAWLYRIATNQAVDLCRRNRLVSWVPFSHRHIGVGEDPTRSLGEQDRVLQALRKLPPQSAAMLLLKDADGFSTREIAAMLGQNYEAARKRLARAREALRQEYLRMKGREL